MAKSRTALDLRIEIADIFDSGRYAGRCTAEELAVRLQARSRSIGKAFSVLGFERVVKAKTIREKRTKKVTKVPAEWSPPKEWPALFRLQREIRKKGVSAAGTLRATDAACDMPDILEKTLTALLLDNVPVNRRGALKAKIKEVILKDLAELAEYQTENILLVELAEALRDTPLQGKANLLRRVSAMFDLNRREAGLPKIERR